MKNMGLAMLMLFFISGCKKEKNSTTNIAGYYKTVAIISDTPADLNNDGVKSNDLYAEITAPLYGPGGPPISFYNFNQQSSFVEVRPLPDQSSAAKLIAFNFPNQVIDSLNNGQYFLYGYIGEFLNYSYQTDSDNQITLINGNSEYNYKPGKLHQLKLNKDGGLTLTLTKKLFCFADRKWMDAEVKVEYEKVN